jgi:RHS repeat-associated protein
MQLSLSGKTLPVTGYQRDRLHRETHRTMGALELETHYDMAGRITHRRCTDNLRDRLVSERRYQWDRADQIIRRMYTDGAPSTPAEKYRQSLWGYDAAGRMTQSLQPEGEERFWYDAADNRTTPEMQPVWNNLLKRLDGVSREYDGFGRMTVRHDTHRRVTQRFSYDDEHRISRVEIDGDAEFTKAEYRYDALGRRTEKQVWRRHARKPARTQYAWSGLQMVGETSDSHPDAAVQYIYTENSYEPLARVDSHGEHADIFWYHTELNGLPDSVTDSSGDTVWRGASTAWGRSLRESTPVTWDTPQNLRFQGQYLDRETGLHYNTFRYYDPAGGCYTQMDPIGLLGGLNTYTYVVDPLGWVDPLGLSVSACSKNAKALREGPQGTVITVKSKREAHELLMEAFPDSQKVRGIGSQDATGIRKKHKMEQFKKRDGKVRYRKDYAMDSKTGRVFGHDDPKGTGHGSLPHVNIKRADGTMVRIDINE